MKGSVQIRGRAEWTREGVSEGEDVWVKGEGRRGSGGERNRKGK